jgi:hypothetical protein
LNLLLFGMKIVKRVFQRLKRMPEILAALSCMFMIFGPVFLAAPLIASSSWTYEDRPISYQELWLSGGGALWAGGGIVMISLAIAFYRAQLWVRYVIPLGFVAMTVFAAFRPNPTFPYEWVGALLWIFCSYWYFNRKQEVVAYFVGSPSPEQ